MKFILAQGNPGTQYATTRHNAGFQAIDFFASEKGVVFAPKPKFHADIAEYSETGEKVLLVKPTTFYNETGVAARALADFYKVDSANILAIHDDLALPLGTLRTREKGRDAGNNGIKSLSAHLGENYARLRVGIRNELADKIPATDFVLGRFSADEQATLDSDLLPKISELIDSFVAGNHSNTSHSL